MALAEGTQGRVVYKAYTTGIMDSNSLPSSIGAELGATGGQVLRRTTVIAEPGKGHVPERGNRSASADHRFSPWSQADQRQHQW